MDHATKPASSPCLGDSTVVACRSGDPNAWTRLQEKVENPLRQAATQALHKDVRAKIGASDLVQDTFLFAYRSAGQFRGSSWGEMIAWLRRILENHIAKTLRDQKWSQKRALNREIRLHEMKYQDPPALNAMTPSQILLADEEREMMTLALSRLPIADQELIVKHYEKQMSFAEIAEDTNRNEAAVRKHWSRAMIRWKQATDLLS